MQVKVCPKCKAQCRPTSAACSSCYTSLESIPVTEAEAPPVAANTTPTAPRPSAGGPPRPQPTQQMSVPPQTRQMGVPAQTQMGQVPPPPPGVPMPPGAFQMRPPVKKSPAGIIALVLAIVFVAICAVVFAVFKAGGLGPEPLPTESPEKAAIAFLEAKKTGDLAKVEPYLSKDSVYSLHHTFANKQAQSAGISSKEVMDAMLWGARPTKDDMVDKQIAATELKGDRDSDERTKIVMVTVDAKPEAAPTPQPLLPPGQTPPPPPEKKVDFGKLFRMEKVEVQYVLVAEGGHWKIDLADTSRRALGLGPRKPLFKVGS